MMDTESKISGIVGTIYDITELKNAERSNALLKSVIDQVKECIWISVGHEDQFQLMYINDTVKHITGYEKEAFFDNPDIYLDLIVPKDREKYFSFLKNSTYPKKIEYSIKRATDDREFALREMVYLAGDTNFGVVTDVTEEKKHEQLMALILLMFNTITTDSIAMVNMTTRKYLYINKAREILYERDSNDFYNNDVTFWFDQCVFNEDKIKIAELLARMKEITLGAELNFSYEFRIVTPKGKMKWVHSRTAIKEIEGEIFSINLDTDITQAKL